MHDNNPNNPVDNNIPAPSPDVAELNKRRALIKSLYQEVLGRDADINGLSYYTVHKEITEDEIRRQMSQSTDHKDLVIKAQKYPEIEKKCIELEDQVIRLQNSNAEKDVLISNLRAAFSSSQQNPQQYSAPNSYVSDMMVVHDQTQQQYQPNFSQGQQPLINVTDLNYPKSNKGCMGFLKSFFGLS